MKIAFLKKIHLIFEIPLDIRVSTWVFEFVSQVLNSKCIKTPSSRPMPAKLVRTYFWLGHIYLSLTTIRTHDNTLPRRSCRRQSLYKACTSLCKLVQAWLCLCKLAQSCTSCCKLEQAWTSWNKLIQACTSLYKLVQTWFVMQRSRHDFVDKQMDHVIA